LLARIVFGAFHSFCVHDPAWWWVKASNLGGLGGPVVRFNLAHVVNVHHGAMFCFRFCQYLKTHSIFACKDRFRCFPPFFVCMILPGGGSRLQTLGGLAAQLFDSTLRTL